MPKIIPREKYTPSKAETFTVEGYNARIRHYLARFRRKSKCYSKAVHMIENSLRITYPQIKQSTNYLRLIILTASAATHPIHYDND